MNQYIQKPKLDIDQACATVTKYLSDWVNCYVSTSEWYQPYSSQVIVTNEYDQICDAKKYIKPQSNVLTVCGSGEQPLFFKMWGADQVLTFDITCHAHLVMSLKVAAIQALRDHNEYNDFIRGLSEYAPNLPRVPNINPVLSKLAADQREYIYRAHTLGFPFCITDSSCDNYSLSPDQYQKLKQSVPEPFPFIWTNIKDLDGKLCGAKFDMIYYSNVLEFLDTSDYKSVLEMTKSHLNLNGTLFLVMNYRNFYNTLELFHDSYRRPAWDVQVSCFNSAKSFCNIAITKCRESR